MTPRLDVPKVAWGAAFALHGNHLRRDLNDLTGERIKPPCVGASVGADCPRLPSIDRHRSTATVPDSVLRQQGTKGVDTQRNSSHLTTDQKVGGSSPFGRTGERPSHQRKHGEGTFRLPARTGVTRRWTTVLVARSELLQALRGLRRRGSGFSFHRQTRARVLTAGLAL